MKISSTGAINAQPAISSFSCRRFVLRIFSIFRHIYLHICHNGGADISRRDMSALKQEISPSCAVSAGIVTGRL